MYTEFYTLANEDEEHSDVVEGKEIDDYDVQRADNIRLNGFEFSEMHILGQVMYNSWRKTAKQEQGKS